MPTTVHKSRVALIATAVAGLAALLFLALSAVSANTRTVTFYISDDRSHGATPCVNELRSDSSCDLQIRVRNNTSIERTWTLHESGANGALDASAITPGTNTIGDCPCHYQIAAGADETYRIRIVVGDLVPGYRTASINAHRGEYHGGGFGYPTARYQLKIEVATTITINTVTQNSVSFSWVGHTNANQAFIFWWIEGNPAAFSRDIEQTSTYTISSLQPSTSYRIRVLPRRGSGTTYQPKEISVTTLAPPSTDPCASTGDYDLDDDGLIEVCNLQQLDAIRHDLNGDGSPDDYPEAVPPGSGRFIVMFGDFTDQQRDELYAAAFPSAASNMGCPTTGCIGYELTRGLNFDTNGVAGFDGGSEASGGQPAVAADPFWNDGRGWLPIMGQTYRNVLPSSRYDRLYYFWGSERERRDRAPFVVHLEWSDLPFNCHKMFDAIFEGNGYEIANLNIDRRNYFVGLFGYVGPDGQIRNVGLTGSGTISGRSKVGALVGQLEGVISGSHAHLDVAASEYEAGGLAGLVFRGARVSESYATGDVSTLYGSAGGLVGGLDGGFSHVTTSFATGNVTSTGAFGGAGGLVGLQAPGTAVLASYATGHIQATAASKTGLMEGPDRKKTTAGGLVGKMIRVQDFTAAVAASYSSSTVSGPVTNIGGLVGECDDDVMINSGYWEHADSTIGRHADNQCGWTHQSQSNLRSQIGYNGIYSDWNVDVTTIETIGSHGGRLLLQSGDDPWDFGTASQYPKIKYCATKTGIDYAGTGDYCPVRDAAHGWQQR